LRLFWGTVPGHSLPPSFRRQSVILGLPSVSLSPMFCLVPKLPHLVCYVPYFFPSPLVMWDGGPVRESLPGKGQLFLTLLPWFYCGMKNLSFPRFFFLLPPKPTCFFALTDPFLVPFKLFLEGFLCKKNPPPPLFPQHQPTIFSFSAIACGVLAPPLFFLLSSFLVPPTTGVSPLFPPAGFFLTPGR